jgi:hypothetical protein
MGTHDFPTPYAPQIESANLEQQRLQCLFIITISTMSVEVGFAILQLDVQRARDQLQEIDTLFMQAKIRYIQSGCSPRELEILRIAIATLDPQRSRAEFDLDKAENKLFWNVMCIFGIFHACFYTCCYTYPGYAEWRKSHPLPEDWTKLPTVLGL